VGHVLWFWLGRRHLQFPHYTNQGVPHTAAIRYKPLLQTFHGVKES
jgi:hypothetical protein